VVLAGDPPHAEIHGRRETAVQPALVLAQCPAMLGRPRVQEGEVDGLLELVDVRTGEEDVRDVSLNVFHERWMIGMKRRIGERANELRLRVGGRLGPVFAGVAAHGREVSPTRTVALPCTASGMAHCCSSGSPALSSAIPSRRARWRRQSVSLTSPTSLPCSTTGRQPIGCWSMSSVALCTVSPGAAVMTFGDMTARTGTLASHSRS